MQTLHYTLYFVYLFAHHTFNVKWSCQNTELNTLGNNLNYIQKPGSQQQEVKFQEQVLSKFQDNFRTF